MLWPFCAGAGERRVQVCIIFITRAYMAHPHAACSKAAWGSHDPCVLLPKRKPHVDPKSQPWGQLSILAPAIPCAIYTHLENIHISNLVNARTREISRKLRDSSISSSGREESVDRNSKKSMQGRAARGKHALCTCPLPHNYNFVSTPFNFDGGEAWSTTRLVCPRVPIPGSERSSV